MANLGYILKESVMDACKDMNDAEFREMIVGAFKYAVYGEEPNFSTPLQRVVFNMEKPAIDYNNKKWADRAIAYKKISTHKRFEDAEQE